jgi:hypothetical protein
MSGSLGVAGGQAAELLEPVEATLDDVAVGVEPGVEQWWSPAAAAFGGAAGDLVRALRGGERDPAPAQHGPGRGMGVGLVGQDPIRALAGSAGSVAADRDLIEQRQQLRVVPGLARGPDDREGARTPDRLTASHVPRIL